MKVSVDGIAQSSIMVGDGVLFSTPQGSTGYNLALRGKAVAPGVPVIQLTPMSCVVSKSPIGSVILSDASVMRIDFENIEKRPGVLYFDGIQLEAAVVRSLTVKKSRLYVRVGYLPELSFMKKVLDWQFNL